MGCGSSGPLLRCRASVISDWKSPDASLGIRRWRTGQTDRLRCFNLTFNGRCQTPISMARWVIATLSPVECASVSLCPFSRGQAAYQHDQGNTTRSLLWSRSLPGVERPSFSRPCRRRHIAAAASSGDEKGPPVLPASSGGGSGQAPDSEQLDRDILALALPSLATLAVDPLLSAVDAAFVGRIGPGPLASLAVSSSVFAFSIFLFNFLSSATGPLVGQAWRGDHTPVFFPTP